MISFNSCTFSSVIQLKLPPIHDYCSQFIAWDGKGLALKMLPGIVRGYVNNIVAENAGLKVILFDTETAGIVSSVYTMSNLLQKEVFLVDRIDNQQREELPVFKCICILRPIASSIEALCDELLSPKYPEYYIYFTNILKQGFLDKIAQADGKERVKSVKEYYMDIYTPTSHYFTLNLESCIGTSVNTWNREALQRTVEGLMSFLLATSKSPVIRFDKSSPMAYRLAEEVDDRFKEASDAFSSGNSDPMTVLFVDRRNDLITPLLSHWTYQSMMHELLEFKNGLVAIHTIDANRHETRKEYSLMEEEDSFYKENIFAVFGAFGENIRQYVEGYREKTNQHQALKEIKDMKKFINDYASYKKMGLVISKHVNIIDEITNQVSKRHLLQLSEIEQAIVSSEEKLHSDFRNIEKIFEVIDMNLQLKLALLFYLKYRNHANFSEFSHEITRRILTIIPKDAFSSFLEYAEYEKSHSQSHSTSLKKSLLQKGKATISSLKGNNFPLSSTNLSSSSTSQQSNSIYTQHRPAIEKILNHLVSGKLSETQFPYFKSSNSNISTQSYLIFFVNGCTYEEVRIASLFSHVYCGSTQTCNFDSLLTDIKQLGTKK